MLDAGGRQLLGENLSAAPLFLKLTGRKTPPSGYNGAKPTAHRARSLTQTMWDLERSENREEYFESLKRFFEEKIPFNTFLGMKVDKLDEGFARLRVPYFENLIGDPVRPALHGGVVSTLADTAGGIAAFTSVGPGDVLSTVDLRVDYLRPAALQDLVAEARVLRTGNRMVVCDIAVFHDDPDHRVATGKGVYNVKRAK